MNEDRIIKSYECAKEVYAERGVDVEAAMEKANNIAISMHCWQGDDVIGFDGADSLTGGIQTTGNYPGRARNIDELRKDIAFSKSLIPGKTKLNMHSSYAEKGSDKVDRDAYELKHFQGWIDFCKEQKMGMDYNTTFFSHPMMDGDFSLSSYDSKKREFWINHGKTSVAISKGIAEALGQPCTLDMWMPDGYKDTCVDTKGHRELMTDALDQILAVDDDLTKVPYCLESKIFGIGVESYTVASHEFSLCYAATRGCTYTLDAGHFHPTETISSKITACLQFVNSLLLHVSRGVRWDSDHSVSWDDETQRIMDEIIYNNYEDRVYIATDYFDASINRIAAWAIGMRDTRKAILNACLSPSEQLREAEHQGRFTDRFALVEERKTLPFGPVWDYYCLQQGVPVALDFIDAYNNYEKEELRKR